MIYFLFIRLCLYVLNFGEQIEKQTFSLKSNKEMTTALFLLRYVEIGIIIFELDLLTIGIVLDIWIEKLNDGVKYSKIAGQVEFDKFKSF